MAIPGLEFLVILSIPEIFRRHSLFNHYFVTYNKVVIPEIGKPAM